MSWEGFERGKTPGLWLQNLTEGRGGHANRTAHSRRKGGGGLLACGVHSLRVRSMLHDKCCETQGKASVGEYPQVNPMAVIATEAAIGIWGGIIIYCVGLAFTTNGP